MLTSSPSLNSMNVSISCGESFTNWYPARTPSYTATSLSKRGHCKLSSSAASARMHHTGCAHYMSTGPSGTLSPIAISFSDARRRVHTFLSVSVTIPRALLLYTLPRIPRTRSSLCLAQSLLACSTPNTESAYTAPRSSPKTAGRFQAAPRRASRARPSVPGAPPRVQQSGMPAARRAARLDISWLSPHALRISPHVKFVRVSNF